MRTTPFLLFPLIIWLLARWLPGFHKAVGAPKDGKNVLWTTDASVELPIKLGVDPNCISSIPPTTVIKIFQDTVAKFGDRYVPCSSSYPLPLLICSLLFCPLETLLVNIKPWKSQPFTTHIHTNNTHTHAHTTARTALRCA